MKYVSVALLLFFFACLPQSLFARDNDAHPIVPGFERFIDVEEVTDRERGMLLLNELNCLSCHAGNSPWSIAPKQAPILTDIGSRVLPEYFEPFLLAPHTVKPGTTMPDVLAGKSTAERQQIAESIAHFLASTGKSVKQNSSTKFVAQGQQLFHTVGCVACHDPQEEETLIATSIPLGKLENKYTLPGLTRFIQDPKHVRPSGRMPQFQLSGEEAQSIATYLLREAVVDSKINFAYYEGSWEKLPKFAELKPVSTGITHGFDMTGWPQKDNFGVVFTGYWTTEKNTKYKFRLNSDDGSRLIIDGELIVDHDGVHAPSNKEKRVKILAGIHEVEIQFFEQGGGEELHVEVTGGGLEGAGLDVLMRATREEPESPEQKSFQIDLAKAAHGKQHFQSVGCASCHELKIDDAALLSSVSKQTPVVELNPAKGCLNLTPDSPAFGLSDSQIRCITAAIEDLKESGGPDNKDSSGELIDQSANSSLEQRVHEKFVTLNCYACHNRQLADRSIRGGVVDVRGDSDEVYERKNWFTGTQVEMGDEGQHPPSLTSIGSKLKPEWLSKVLTEGIKDRPYMYTRMPMFGSENFGKLTDDLVELDRLKDIVQVDQTEDEYKIKTHGRFFAGDEALSCIKCHTFANFPATGIQAINLTTMTNRLNKDWFQAYMLKPSKFRKGTRMPESWPGGKSFYPDILEGDTHKQIDAIWQFLSDGEEAAKPIGLVRAKLELKPVESPKMYRNFIAGAGPRAIGVGYPEQVNIAFDAELCRMALVWQENFIDASRHWTGRGQGFEPPLGENILELPDAVTFSTSLDPERWSKDKPEIRPKFKGYRFDKKRRPIFIYQLGDVTIEDQPLPYLVDDRAWLKRNFKITSKGTEKLYYLAARGDTVEFQDGVVTVDKRWTSSFPFGSKASLANPSNGEVVYEIDLSSGSAELEQIYKW